MREIMDIYRDSDIPNDIKIELIKKIGVLVDNHYAANVTGELVTYLCDLLKNMEVKKI